MEVDAPPDVAAHKPPTSKRYTNTLITLQNASERVIDHLKCALRPCCLHSGADPLRFTARSGSRSASRTTMGSTRSS